MLKVPKGLRWVGRIYILGVTVRFSFDCVNSRKIQGLSKIKQRERLMEVYIIYSPYWLHTIDWCGVMGATIYLHWRGAFGVARFDNPGNLREAYTVKRATEQGFTSVLYMSVTSRVLLPQLESAGHRM